MNLLCTLHDSNIFPNTTNADSSEFRQRRAARAVISDEMGRILLLNVGKLGFHKLPGGGIEDDEETTEALSRELLEETGYAADIHEEVGETVEHRSKQELTQISYAFVGSVTGEQTQTNYTESENVAGFEVEWAHSIDDAISLLESDKTEDYGGAFMVKRDLAILKAARSLVVKR